MIKRYERMKRAVFVEKTNEVYKSYRDCKKLKFKSLETG